MEMFCVLTLQSQYPDADLVVQPPLGETSKSYLRSLCSISYNCIGIDSYLKIKGLIKKRLQGTSGVLPNRSLTHMNMLSARSQPKIPHMQVYWRTDLFFSEGLCRLKVLMVPPKRNSLPLLWVTLNPMSRNTSGGSCINPDVFTPLKIDIHGVL